MYICNNPMPGKTNNNEARNEAGIDKHPEDKAGRQAAGVGWNRAVHWRIGGGGESALREPRLSLRRW
jgi:hypothetical protein